MRSFYLLCADGERALREFSLYMYAHLYAERGLWSFFNYQYFCMYSPIIFAQRRNSVKSFGAMSLSETIHNPP